MLKMATVVNTVSVFRVRPRREAARAESVKVIAGENMPKRLANHAKVRAARPGGQEIHKPLAL